MYYSSENSDNEVSDQLIHESRIRDFSYLSLDLDSMSSYIRNSVQEFIEFNRNVPKNIYNLSENNDDAATDRTLSDEGVKYETQGARKKTFSATPEIEDLSTNCDESEIELIENVTEKLYLQNNLLLDIPAEVICFSKLKFLDLSNNNLSHVSNTILKIASLQVLYLKNNALQDDSWPKDLTSLTHLKEINMSGNYLTKILEQFYEISSLRYLYMGSNQITEIPPGIKTLKNLQVLHLGGNLLEQVPDELGDLSDLSSLVLCDNHIKKLPRAISRLTKLKSLLLHRNKICCLPVEIVTLRGLNELSLRENPLVTKFVNSCAREIMYTSPTLKELAARSMKSCGIKYSTGDIPVTLHDYLSSGHRCVNPKCKGMYFTSCVEHIKFVDFCGKYRVPLMHYLCSSRCTSQTPTYYRSSSDSDSDDNNPSRRIKKVLLGGDPDF